MQMETKLVVEIPWYDTEKWELKKWYPFPCTFTDRDYDGYIIDGYGIFELDEDGLPGDITPVGDFNLTFDVALEICETHNGECLLK